MDRVRRGTEGLLDDEQGVFRKRRGCEDQIFTLKQIGKKAHEEKTYDSVNNEAPCHVVRMHDVDAKLWNGIESMYVNSFACVKKG